MEFITLFGPPKKKEPTVFEKIKGAVKQTQENFTERIQELVEGKKEIDPAMLDELEAIMIGADVGVATHSVRACSREWITELSKRAIMHTMPLHAHACELFK